MSSMAAPCHEMLAQPLPQREHLLVAPLLPPLGLDVPLRSDRLAQGLPVLLCHDDPFLYGDVPAPLDLPAYDGPREVEP
eukprot:CAMPEP_0174922328 /NCGR_PEP_ID=MMETSP1355-20121228/5797_1 /TAXON_ID=464990 /ORGANISM="Hemiselmis tepida, Strain CCMP443" /LENGTH=78 /DNA_ID=CAMNT_0016167903 /DNA_START=131 /DNA_END=366 /DNA_ORIENTATION=-